MDINSKALRELLISTGVLEIDQDGDAVFAGLTASESKFFAKCKQLAPSDLEPAETLVFNQLKYRHLRAQMRNLSG